VATPLAEAVARSVASDRPRVGGPP
jgi:hypothetical protein